MTNHKFYFRFFPVALFLLLSVLLSACGQSPQEQALQTARQLSQTSSLNDTEAITSLSASNDLLERLASVKIKASQRQVYVLKKLLDRYKSQKMWPRAAEIVAQLIDLQPTESRWHLEKGQIYSNWAQVDPRHVEPARRGYQTALELSPDSLAARYGLGILYGFRGDQPERARQYFKQVTKHQPITAKNRPIIRRARFALGRLEFEQGNLRESARQFRSVTKMESIPSRYHFLAYRNLGQTYRAMNNLDRARKSYRQAYKIQPTDDTVRRRLRELGVDVSDRFNRYE